MGDYRRAGLCLLFAYGIAGAGEASWEELIRRSEMLSSQGNFTDAETALFNALKVAEHSAPPDIRLSKTQHHLGTVYRELGRFPEAEKWYRRSLSTWKSSEDGLPRPLISLASLYLENGLHGKAERLLDPWLRAPEMRFDAADPSSVRLLHNFAALQHRRRNYSRADVLYRRALMAAEKTFGPEDREVALLLNNLGLLLVDAGRHEEAGQYLERALTIWEGTLGPSHPDTARASTNLAAYYCSIRDYARAEPLFQRALATVESGLGPENLAGTILTEYALMLRKTKRKKEAKLLEIRATAIRQRLTGQELGRHTVDFQDLITSRDVRDIE